MWGTLVERMERSKTSPRCCARVYLEDKTGGIRVVIRGRRSIHARVHAGTAVEAQRLMFWWNGFFVCKLCDFCRVYKSHVPKAVEKVSK